jgi:hypothetical protein
MAGDIYRYIFYPDIFYLRKISECMNLESLGLVQCCSQNLLLHLLIYQAGYFAEKEKKNMYIEDIRSVDLILNL